MDLSSNTTKTKEVSWGDRHSTALHVNLIAAVRFLHYSNVPVTLYRLYRRFLSRTGSTMNWCSTILKWTFITSCLGLWKGIFSNIWSFWKYGCGPVSINPHYRHYCTMLFSVSYNFILSTMDNFLKDNTNYCVLDGTLLFLRTTDGSVGHGSKLTQQARFLPCVWSHQGVPAKCWPKPNGYSGKIVY